MRVIVVGAGLSGLMAAQSLSDDRHDVIVFDKGRGVGGRLATRRIGDATLDHGAQFFTVRSEEFASHVNTWLNAGVVHEWCRGFDSEDGHPRYAGSKGMSGIAKHLAQGLDVRTNALVFSLERTATGYNVITDDGVAHACDKVLLTAPIPQSFSLMFGGAIEMPDEMRTIDYDRTLGLLAVLDSANHNVSSPGGMQNPDEVFSFIGDNSAKGISATHALTFHANEPTRRGIRQATPHRLHPHPVRGHHFQIKGLGGLGILFQALARGADHLHAEADAVGRVLIQ